MKVRASIKKRTPDSKIVRRKGRLYVINKKIPNISSVKAKKDFKCEISVTRKLENKPLLKIFC